MYVTSLPSYSYHQDGDTALIMASYNNHTEVTKVLLDAGAKINIASKKVL